MQLFQWTLSYTKIKIVHNIHIQTLTEILSHVHMHIHIYINKYTHTHSNI